MLEIYRSVCACAECAAGLLLEEGRCERNCSEGFYLEPPGLCARCHYSCRACAGPNDYHCSLCHGDAILVPYDQVISLPSGSINHNKI